ncbi:MAG: Fic/DOC family protein [Vulcanimicrobiaceae bacterium]
MKKNLPVGEDPYVYPGTRVLINALGIRDRVELDRVEANIVGARFAELLLRGVPGELSPAWHKGIHRSLFGELYPLFAGDYRRIYIAKSGEAPYANPAYLQSNAEAIFREISAPGRFSEAAPEFRRELARVMGDIHVLHPFREGNTRTLQIATAEIAKRAGHLLRWQDADPTAIRQAGTEAAFGDYGPYERILAAIMPSDERQRFIERAKEAMRVARTTLLTSAIAEQATRSGSVVSGKVIARDERYVAIATGPRSFAVLEGRKLSQSVSLGERVKARIGTAEIAIETRGRGQGHERSR